MAQNDLVVALQRSTVAIQKLKKQLAAYHEPIAIIGMGCRFPGPGGTTVDRPAQFWENLRNGVDAITETPANRWKLAEYYDPDVNAPGKTHIRHGGFIDGVDQFDPAFFRLSPREVVVMDPQHRLLLETTWEALEYANILPKTLLNQPVGVFIGFTSSNEYVSLSAFDNLTNLHAATGVAGSTAAGRISYLLGLTGPCLAVDTACSSSLTAVHLACQSLRNGECDAALAGGVNLMLAPHATIVFAKGQMLAADGRCKTFDAAANGFVRGEGCGVVVLKRLSDALADGNNILAVIRGTAVNQDGPSGGLTVPNGPAQERVIKQALADAGLTPDQVQYLEAHGTGTPLGDPIEIGAIRAVFGQREQPLYVGSVKTNVGHLEIAAGIVGLIKVVLALQNGEIPPHLHFHTPNPHIDWHDLPVAIPTTLTPWPALPAAGERIAGISSFGFSGTNAHLIVSQAPQEEQKTEDRRQRTEGRERTAQLLTIAAESEKALRAYAQRYVAYLAAYPAVDLADLCYTSHVGRTLFPHRLSVTASAVPELQQRLAAYGEQANPTGVSYGMAPTRQATPKVVFLFTGQGAQYLGMGRSLYETQPVFRQVIEHCEVVAQQVLGRSLIELLYPTTDPAHNDLIESHPCGQAVNFAVQCALVEVWRTWGIQPDLVLGHSLGDFAAAYTAGVLSLEEGLRLVSERGRLMEQAVGSMVAVMGSEAEVAPFVAPYADVVIGVINGPRSVVISGGHDHVQAATAALEAAGFKTRKVAVPMAAHSPLLDPVLAEFETLIRETITLYPPQRPVVSSMTGKLVTHELTDPAYWRHHLRHPVRFVDGVETLAAEGVTIFIEIGPKPTLLGMVEPILDQMPRRQEDQKTGRPEENASASRLPLFPSSCLFLPTLRQNEDDWRQMVTTLGELYVRGVAIDWQGFEQDVERHKLLLPTYPFQRERYWLEESEDVADPSAPPDGFAQWLATNSLAELTDLVATRGHFGDEERATVARVLHTLEAEKRAQQQKAQVEQVLYEVAWEPQPLFPSPLPTGTPFATPGRWLILADAGGLGAALAGALTALGETVALVPTGATLDAVRSLLTSPADVQRALRGIVHLWALDWVTATLTDLTTLLQSQERTLGALLHLVQSVAEATTAAGAPPRLWVITQHAQAVTATDPVAVAQTPLWGMGRTVTLEHGDRWGGLIDLDLAAKDATALATTAQTLLTEILQTGFAGGTAAQATGEEQVAYRQGRRYVARLLPARPAPAPASLTIRPDGLYLITGGLGSLGLQTAQWLVAEGARHLLLLGRRGVQQPAQQARLDALTAQGVTITTAPVDVADEAGMTHLFADIAAGPYPLRGVIHTAGVLGYKALRSLDWADFAAVLRPKVVGGWLLHRLTAGLELDFFVGYSSGAAIWGSKQQAHYGAANHFLDGLMAYRRGLGLPGLSIAWGPWAGPPGLPSMVTPEGQALLQAMGLRTFTAEEGLAIQAHLLHTTANQVTAADVEWPRLQALYAMTKPRRFLAEVVARQTSKTTVTALDNVTDTTAASSVMAELAALPDNRRLDHLRSYVQQTVAQVLGIAQRADRAAAAALDMTTGFADLGMDSLMALELRRHLERGLACTLPSTVAFEQPTVDEMARYLLDLMRHRMGNDKVLVLVEPVAEVGYTETPDQTATYTLGLDEPIAVISMACRLPGADTPEQFWQLLQAGADLIREVPSTRWSLDEFYDPRRPTPGKMYTREAAFIDEVDRFDPLFFGISPREALSMDPQQRLLLEIGWEALERAGLAPSRLADSQTGVFIGISGSDYRLATGIQDIAEMDLYGITSAASNAAAGRLAYTLGLQGPTMAVDSACSSSLVALHLACQSLHTGECDLALSGGVSLMLSPVGHIGLSQMGALAPDGRCKTFDAAADGYGRGEGCAMVILKRLSDAERDGDTILAVIKGSAVNHNGFSSGFTVPNKRAHEKVIRQALANAGVSADAISYIEAHGTGTSLGDPIELRALGAVFGAARAAPLLVGSVKTNIGHLEAAAGITGFIKTVLALYHGQLPPHLHFTTPNPYIEWDEFAVTVPTQLQPWPHLATGAKGLAGVSAFGVSGTNAHVIVAAPPHPVPPQSGEGAGRGSEGAPERPVHLLTLSAKSGAALAALAARYGAYVRSQPAVDVGDLCYTAATGRSHFSQRVALVANSQAELLSKLATVEQGARAPGVIRGAVGQQRPRVVFLFTGQGAQYLGMGRELYETAPTFRAILERCEVVAQAALGRSLLELIYPTTSPETPLGHNDLLESHPCGQAVNFALECALADLWRSWGIQPDLVLGHSLGDFAAAYTAGVLALEDGLRLVIERGRLMETAVGSMVSVLAAEASVLPFLRADDGATPRFADVTIGVINSLESVVISGGAANVALVAQELQAAGIKTRKLDIPVAAHSPLLDPILDAFEAAVRSVPLTAPKLPVVSSMTGQRVAAELTDPVYWRQHLRNPVRFADGVATLAAEGATSFIEIGPKPTLLAMVEQVLDQGARSQEAKKTGRQEEGFAASLLPLSPSSCLFLPSLRQNQPDWQQMVESLGELYVRGVAIDWVGFEQGYPRRKVLLPTYPFQRQRYWLAPSHDRTTRSLHGQVNGQGKGHSNGALNGRVNGAGPQDGFAQLLAAHTTDGSIAQLAERLAGRKEVAGADKALVLKVLAALAAENRALHAAEQIKSMLYAVVWEEQPLLTPVALPQTPGRWLILTDGDEGDVVGTAESSVGQALAVQLTALGETVDLVTEETTLTALTRQLLMQDSTSAPLRGVIHLWALKDGTDLSGFGNLTGLGDLMQRQQRNLGTLLHLVQTLDKIEGAAPRLWVVTRNAQQLAPEDTVAVAQTPLWGMGRVVTLEHSALWGGLLDVDGALAPTAIAQRLLAELLAAQTGLGEEQIAYRAGERYVARLAPAHPAPSGKTVAITADGSYLITGGLGGLGLQNAYWLMEQGVRHLILTGRGGVKVPEQQAALDELRANGVTVKVVQVDVADEAGMTQLFADLAAAAKNGTPPLRGIIHVAGVGDGQLLRTLQWTDVERVLRPKVLGGWLLHRLSAELNLDFFIAYSSGAGIWGGKELAHYGAANHFLDGLMAYRRRLGLPGLSLAWGLWDAPGMATPELQAALAAIGVHAFAPALALAAQAHLLQSTAAQITVANNDWAALQDLYAIGRPRRFLTKLANGSTTAADPQETPLSERAALLAALQGVTGDQWQQRVDDYVRAKVAAVLRIPDEVPIDTEVDLMSLGLDSLMAIEIRNRISEGLAVTIPVTKLMDNLSIAGLARFVGEQLAAPQAEACAAGAPGALPATGEAAAVDIQSAEIEVRI